MNGCTFSYNVNEEYTTMQSTSTQSSHKQYNHQQQVLQQSKSQRYAPNYASQFPHIVSALLGEFPSSASVFGNPEYVVGESLIGATAPSSAYWNRDEACTYTTQTQYQFSSSDSGNNFCYETNKSALDENMNLQEGSSCDFQQQSVHHMSAFASGSAELMKDQSDSQFPEIEDVEELCQEALRNDHIHHSLPMEEQNIYSGITAQLSLLDLENPLEELMQNVVHNNADVRSRTNTVWNPSQLDICGETRDKDISTSSSPPRFCQL
jgi:hypothetical protein